MTTPGTWRAKAPSRNLVLYRGEDIDIAGRFRRDGQPWIPPVGTECFFRTWNSTGTSTDYPCTIVDGSFSLHVESAVAEMIPDGAPWWFYVKTPETPNGNPKVITPGKVQRVDPA